MNHSFHMRGMLRLLLIGALCLAGGSWSAPTATAWPQSSESAGKAKAGYKGPGFVLVGVDRVPPPAPIHNSGISKDQQGNEYTTRWDANYLMGDSSFKATYKEVTTEVEQATGNSRITRSIEREGGVSWTPPPPAVPPGFVYQPQPKFSGSSQGVGIPSPQEGGDVDLQIAAFGVSLDWPQGGPEVAQVSLTYGPKGVKTFSNKPIVFPDLKAIQAALGNYVLNIHVLVVATSASGTDVRVTYNYESRPEVTSAAVTPAPRVTPKPAPAPPSVPTPEVTPKPPQEPVAPTPPQPAPAPPSVPTPEVTPKPPQEPVAPTPPQPSPAPPSVPTPEVTPKPPQEPVAPTPPQPAPAPPSVPTPEVTPKAPEKPPSPTPPQKPGSAEQRFEVYNLGEGMNILQSANKPRGILSIGGSRLKYQEAGKPVFSVGRTEIKEIDANTLLGYNTGTFHVILKSGKTYNFAPASLSVADGQKMLESMKHAFP